MTLGGNNIQHKTAGACFGVVIEQDQAHEIPPSGDLDVTPGVAVAVLIPTGTTAA